MLGHVQATFTEDVADGTSGSGLVRRQEELDPRVRDPLPTRPDLLHSEQRWGKATL